MPYGFRLLEARALEKDTSLCTLDYSALVSLGFDTGNEAGLATAWLPGIRHDTALP